MCIRDRFTTEDINSKSTGKLSENAIVSNVINKYKNAFGKAQVVVIQKMCIRDRAY